MAIAVRGAILAKARRDPDQSTGFGLVQDALDTTVIEAGLPGQGRHTGPAVALIVTGIRQGHEHKFDVRLEP